MKGTKHILINGDHCYGPSQCHVQGMSVCPTESLMYKTNEKERTQL